MLRLISCVAAPCSSTAAAIVEVISEIRPMVCPISLIEVTASCVADCIPAICKADFLGRLSGLRRQRLDLGCHHRKAAAGLARARRLDRGIERQQVGLLGDRGDQFHHFADAAGRVRQLIDAAVGSFGLLDGIDRDLVDSWTAG